MIEQPDLDDRVYVIRAPWGEYFEGWRPTKWETVKRVARWTPTIKNALQIKFGDLAKENFVELVCGFSGLRLIHL